MKALAWVHLHVLAHAVMHASPTQRRTCSFYVPCRHAVFPALVFLRQSWHAQQSGNVGRAAQLLAAFAMRVAHNGGAVAGSVGFRARRTQGIQTTCKNGGGSRVHVKPSGRPRVGSRSNLLVGNCGPSAHDHLGAPTATTTKHPQWANTCGP